MTNILLSSYNIAAGWCMPALSRYITAGAKVAVLAYSFRADVPDNAAWENLYGDGGAVRVGIAKSFAPYDVNKIFCINYFDDRTDRARAAVAQADILYLPWGMPDLLMSRVLERGLYLDIANFRGTVIGIAAGAQVQLDRYHITPGKDHPSFAYSTGFGFISGIDIEPRYDPGNAEAGNALVRVARERGVPVYGIAEAGGIVIDGGKAELIGEVYQARDKEQ
ncbi:hypothetical protein FACS1894133_3050 [Clostridia bacterium]|nr:hypothetical protein FACS1894133_3050 [Clostridia bacterium]